MKLERSKRLVEEGVVYNRDAYQFSRSVLASKVCQFEFQTKRTWEIRAAVRAGSIKCLGDKIIMSTDVSTVAPVVQR